MPAARLLTPIEEPEKVKKLFLVMNEWSEIEIKTSENSGVKAQSFAGNQNELQLTFNGQVPSSGDASLVFDLGGTIYHLKGKIKTSNEVTEFKPKEFFKELRRKVVRLNI